MKSFVSQLADFAKSALVVTMCSAFAAAMVHTATNAPRSPQAERSVSPDVQDPPLDGLHSEMIFSLQYRYGDEVGE